ncbi:MAG: hypothetical protein DME22_18520 [Verrucomicrobia bacterium]|nr:MAG: hypothetical protein DME22_18520 [Verrucomicrobiota bacterium]PYJ97654.1 MAG: hypothetical protein DME23_14385 [Verrucomicrobiota bacterium]
MQQEMERFLNLRNIPARVTAEQAAGILGIAPHEIPILMSRGLLKPLGHPPPNGQKFFLSAILQDSRRDEKWWGKACDAITEYWRYKNSRKGQGTPANGRQSCPGAVAAESAAADN